MFQSFTVVYMHSALHASYAFPPWRGMGGRDPTGWVSHIILYAIAHQNSVCQRCTVVRLAANPPTPAHPVAVTCMPWDVLG